MEIIFEDIPRIYTALAEWSVCTVFVFMIEKRFSKMNSFFISIAALICQIIVLEATNAFSLLFWIPGMLLAVGCMYLFIFCCCKTTKIQALYCCATAFVVAEFGASLEWQFLIALEELGIRFGGRDIFLLIVTYVCVCFAFFYLERSLLKKEYLQHLSKWELITTVVLVILTFTFSNISFLLSDTTVEASVYYSILKTRTLVDLAGLAVLYAFQSRISEYLREKEIEAIHTLLKSQYDQYRSYQESMEMVRIQRHDLKHHLAILRAETDMEKREEWLDALETELNESKNAIYTGNRVLDILLMAKQGIIKKNEIHFTWVADGALLDFIHVTDICTIFGNALDNAIESVVALDRAEKRMIHFSVSEKRNFVYIQMQNYCENEPDWDGKGGIYTTKADNRYHGYGIKSIRYTVEKYGGSIQISWKDNWFEMGILIPTPIDPAG